MQTIETLSCSTCSPIVLLGEGMGSYVYETDFSSFDFVSLNNN